MKIEDVLFLCDGVLVATVACMVCQIVDGYNPFWLLT